MLAGSLEIDPHCVYIVSSSGRRTTLVWHADRVRWDEETSAIAYANPISRAVVVLANGMPLSLGGGFISLPEEDPDSFRQPFGGRWVQVPAPGCESDAMWFVGEIVR